MELVSYIKSCLNVDKRPHDLRDRVKSEDRVRIIVGAAEDSYEG